MRNVNHTLDKLARQRERLDEKIAKLRAQLQEQAIAQCRALIAEHGLTCEDLFGKQRKRKQ